MSDVPIGDVGITISTGISTGVEASTHPIEAVFVVKAGEIGIPLTSANIISTYVLTTSVCALFKKCKKNLCIPAEIVTTLSCSVINSAIKTGVSPLVTAETICSGPPEGVVDNTLYGATLDT